MHGGPNYPGGRSGRPNYECKESLSVNSQARNSDSSSTEDNFLVKEKVNRIKRIAKSQESVVKLARELLKKVGTTIETRYMLEYTLGLYESYKPGVDEVDSLQDLVGSLNSFKVLLEIGAGPANIASAFTRNSNLSQAIAVDFVPHPDAFLVAEFQQGDITRPQTVTKLRSSIKGKTLIVLSYCLDRIPNQKAAIKNFASLVKEREDNVGLITVCLPAVFEGPAIKYEDANKAGWFTKGESAQEDRTLIIEACFKEGLNLDKSRETVHYGRSLDGYEELPCYVLVFTNA